MLDFYLFRGTVPMIDRCIACQWRGDIQPRVVVGYRIENHPTRGPLRRCYCAEHAPELPPPYTAPVSVPIRQQRAQIESSIHQRISEAIAALDKEQRIYTAREVQVKSGVYPNLLAKYPHERRRILDSIAATTAGIYLAKVERAIKLLDGVGPLSMSGIVAIAGIGRKSYDRYPAIRRAIDVAVLKSGGTLPRRDRAEVA